MSKKLIIGLGAIGLGGVGLAVAIVGKKQRDALVHKIEESTRDPRPSGNYTPMKPQTPPTIPARLTKYNPYAAKTEAEKKMEGGFNDRLGRPLISLDKHLKDPVTFPYASVSGDDAIWPYGQRISIDAFPNAVFRVVDTGGNFRGSGKVYRLSGHEPLDVLAENIKVPETAQVGIFPGDNFKNGAPVVVTKLPTVVQGYEADVDYQSMYLCGIDIESVWQ